ncbi:ATP12-domain-containing protein [Microthyrium microscopicum]|uniref:ATP12-domain-containing protein n=1 Tax=Microthyrium microscopicum TaxID=703497 RepID=A0A6A6URQ2_9PEZI|nr:ATP12-domain-containing protein [Microthyrium microscopicum]
MRSLIQPLRHRAHTPLISIRSIHASIPKAATPIAHPTAPGPPPPPPTTPTSDREARIARKKKQAALLRAAQTIRADAAKPTTTSPLKKRFWTDVHIIQSPEDGHYQIHLDARPVRDIEKTLIKVPRSKPHLATALALEWDMLTSAQQALKTHYIPLTSLVARALEIQAADGAGNAEPRASIVRMLIRYLTTDTLLCWAPEPVGVDVGHDNLRARQRALAEPIVAHLTGRMWPGVRLEPTLADSIVPKAQEQSSLDVVRGWLAGLPAWELAGVERAVLATKSLCVAARLVAEWSEELGLGSSEGKKFGVEDAAIAVSAEVAWQTGQWGEVEDTHDVEKEDLRRQLGGVVLLVNGMKRTA